MKNTTEREEIEMLLPLFVSGTLDPEEHETVANYLRKHEDMRHQIDLIKAEREANISAHEQLGAMSAGSLQRLHAQIDCVEAQAPFVQSLMDMIRQFFLQLTSFDTALGKAAVAAAGAIILFQAVVISSLLSPSGNGSDYETASRPGDAVPVTGTRLLIAFSDEASMKDVASLISEIGGSIVKGPSAGGIFTLQISEKILSEAEVDRLIADLGARDKLVRFAVPAE